MKKIIFLTSLLLGLVMTGCSSKLTSDLVPGATLNTKGKFYVVHFEPDKRNLNVMIADRLKLMGYDAIAGEQNNMPSDIETVVTYVDNWQWDITNYMIEINVQFRDAKDNSLIMSGKSHRTSLVRKSPEEMIRETLEVMLKASK